MSMKEKSLTPQQLRDQCLREINNSDDSTEKAKQLSENLFTLGLTMYSQNFSIDSIIYNSFSKAAVDDNISLHPEQLSVLKKIDEAEGLIFSAPTSFGKTFVIFEYIARQAPKNVILIVPTLALVDEYNKKILKRYRNVFSKYRVFLTVDPDKEYDFEGYNIFILTHDRVVEEGSYKCIKQIDFLVIDEVYKLQKDQNNDRVLILNLAYYHLVQKAKKHVLLAPFIGGVKNLSELGKKPEFYRTEFSPVVNEVKTYNIINEKDRFKYINKIMKEEVDIEDKTLIYFPTVKMLYKYVNKSIDNYSAQAADEAANIDEFIDWVRNEVHEEWYVIKAMEKGFLVHNGQLPVGIRLFQMNLYENSDIFNKMLCTATLLEGVNTTAKNIIISKPARGAQLGVTENFDAFDFYNLVGRSGRLSKHILGNAYYIKGIDDPVYIKEDAIKQIQFELTDNSEDIDIHTGNYNGNEDYIEFLKKLNITHEDYIENIGSKLRFRNVLQLYERYLNSKSSLIAEIDSLLQDSKKGRYNLVRILHRIFEGNDDKFKCSIINELLNKQRRRVRVIIENIRKHYKSKGIDDIISSVIRIKTSYIEYSFYNKLIILLFFMKCEKVEKKYADTVDDKIKSSIDYLYFTDSPSKKLLKDIGIYDSEIQKIVNIVGDDFEDINEFKIRALNNYSKIMANISVISKYIINDLCGK